MVVKGRVAEGEGGEGWVVRERRKGEVVVERVGGEKCRVRGRRGGIVFGGGKDAEGLGGNV